MSRSNASRSRDKATELTSIIATPRDQYEKVRWNFGRFITEQSSFNPKADAVVYAAIDFAKAANSLLDWVAKARGVKPASLLPEVRWSDAIRTMANVAKHSESFEDHWPGGSIYVQLVATDGVEVRIFAGPSPRDIEQRLPAWGHKAWWEIWLMRDGQRPVAAR